MVRSEAYCSSVGLFQGNEKMISKATCILYLCMRLAVINGLKVSFSESDSSVTETDLRATAAFTKSGLSRGDVTCTLIPLSLEQARLQYGFELSDSSIDPAETGLDFSPAVLQHVFVPGIASVDEVLHIDIVNDEIYESDEVFIVRLNVSTSDPLDEAELEIETQYLILRITADFHDEPRLSIVDKDLLESTQLSENNGLLEDYFVIDKGVVSELPLSFSLEIDSHQSAEFGADYQIQLGQYTIYPNQSNVSVDLRIIDDDTAEDVESFSLSLLTPAGSDSVRINIADNDEVRIRVGNRTEIQVDEGNSIVTLCAEIVSPAVIEREANVLGTLTQGTATARIDYISNILGFALNPNSLRACQNLKVLDDDIPEPTEFFNLTLSHFGDDPLVIIEPTLINFAIIDNDNVNIDVDIPGGGPSLIAGEGESHVIYISVPQSIVVEVQVTISVTSDTAINGYDFEISVNGVSLSSGTGTFTLSSGSSSSLQLNLTITDDIFVENEEHFSLVISLIGSPSSPPHVIPVSIIDNDPVTVGFVNDTQLTVIEGEAIRLCGKMADILPSLLQREIVLSGTTQYGSAQEGSDFESLSWNFTFSSSSPAIVCVEVVTLVDSVSENFETFSVAVELASNPEPLITVSPSSLNITIVEVPMVQANLPGNDSSRTSLIAGEGESHVIYISVPQSIVVEVQVTISVASDTAINGDDFEISVNGVSLSSGTGTFTLSSGSSSSLQLNLTLSDDIFVEYEEHFSLVISLIGSPSSPPRVIPVSIIDNDPVTVGFVNDSQLTVIEGEEIRLCGEMADISPSLLQREIVLSGTTQSGSAQEGSDFESLSWNFTFSSSSPAIVCVEVVTLVDSVSEISETFSVAVELATNPEPLITVSPSSLNITIVEVPMVQVNLPGNDSSRTSLIAGEGESHVIYISVPQSIVVEVQVTISVTSDTAINGDDFEISVNGVSLSSGTGTFTLSSGSSSSLQLNLTITDDIFVEYEEHFSLVISLIGSPSSPPHVIPVSIIDNDPVTVGFVNDTQLTVVEGEEIRFCGKMADISPSLLQREIVLSGTTQSGSAQEGSDFESLSWNFTFSSSSPAIVCVEVVTLVDSVSENFETFSVAVELASNPEPLITISPSSLNITIVEVPMVQVNLPGNDSSRTSLIAGEGESHVIYISVPQSIVVEVQVTISVTSDTAINGDDFEISVNGVSLSSGTGTFTLSSGSSSSLQLNLTITDDIFVEYEEHFSLVISLIGSPSLPPHVIPVSIIDNDPVTVGFVNDTQLTVVEGEEIRLCGEMADISPSLLQREIVLSGTIQSGSAQESSDFELLSWSFVFSSSSPAILCVSVATVNDTTPELPETFSVTVVLTTQPESLISVTPSFITITILNDDVPKVVAEFTPTSTPGGGSGSNIARTREGGSVSIVYIRISSVGVHPFPLDYDVSVTPSGGADVKVEEGTFSLLPLMDEKFLSVEVVDDVVAEEEERVSIVITFQGQPSQVLTLFIQDNDNVMIGVDSGGITVVEGGEAQVHLSIISPSSIDRSVVVMARTRPITATVDVDYKSVELGLSLNGTQKTSFFVVQTFSNDKPNAPLTFLIQLEVRGQIGVELERNSVRVTIADDDSTPLAPVITEVILVEEEGGGGGGGGGDGGSKSYYYLTITWKISIESGPRPVTSFTIIVTLTNSSTTSGSNTTPMGQLPTYFNISVDGNTRDHTLGPVDPTEQYSIQICSFNSLGSNCSTPYGYPVGVEGDRTSLPAAVIVSILLLIFLILVCCCLCCLCVCLCWCDFSEWISYHPERKERKYRAEFKRLRDPSGQDPSGQSVVLEMSEFDRIGYRAQFLTETQKKEREGREEREKKEKKEKEERIEASTGRKKEMTELEIKRKQNEKLSDVEQEAKEQSQDLLVKVSIHMEEQDGEIKKSNETILNTKCHTIREVQLEERDEITNRGMEVIQSQIKARDQQRLLDMEKKDQETQTMLKYLKRLQEEDMQQIVKKRETHQKTVQIEQEKLEDVKVIQYFQKAERVEEGLASEPRATTDQMLIQARQDQIHHKEHFVAVQAQRDREEFDRVLRAQQDMMEQESKKEITLHQGKREHTIQVRQQMKQNELEYTTARRVFFDEGIELNQEAKESVVLKVAIKPEDTKLSW